MARAPRPLVLGELRIEIDVGEDVAVQHQEALVEQVPGEPQRAAGPERVGLLDVTDAYPELLPVAQHAPHAVGHEPARQDHLVDAVPSEPVDHERDVRAVGQRDDRLGDRRGQRPQPRSLAAGEDQRLHRARTLQLDYALGQAAVPAAGVGSPRRAREHVARPDDHGRELRARDRRVEHLPAQEERAARGVRDDHRDRQLDPLAAVHRARVRRPQAVGLLERQPEDRLLGAEDQRGVVLPRPRPRRAAAAACRSSAPARGGCGPVIISLSPIRSRPPRTGSAVRIEPLAQRLVERVDPELASIDGREHLDVADRVDAVVLGEALADQRDDLDRAPRAGRRARPGTGRGASPPRR